MQVNHYLKSFWFVKRMDQMCPMLANLLNMKSIILDMCTDIEK